jgi:hypothetical protein
MAIPEQRYDGICKVATGEFFSELKPTSYPFIFPKAQVASSDQGISLTLVPNALQQIERVQSNWRSSMTSFVTSVTSYGKEHPFIIAATAGVAALGGSWMVKNLAVFAKDNLEISMTTTAVAILGHAVYQCYSHPMIPCTQNRTFFPIKYSLEEDIIVQEELAKINPHQSPLVDDLDRAFRNYRLNVCNWEKLEGKIHKLIAEHQIKNGQQELPLLEQMERLIAGGEAAREEAIHGKTISVFIGPSGSGKTTAGNYLCGRRMKAIDPTLVRGPSGRPIIIAEDSLGNIGHKFGPNSSETFEPQLFEDERNGITYCDFPGLRDNRGTVVEVCNSLAIIDVIKNAGIIQGFLFFINKLDLNGGRKERLIKDMKVLQLLLQNFEPYKDSVLFIITNAEKTDTLQSFYTTIHEVLNTVIQPSYSDQELALFVQEVLASNVLTQRIRICDPCNEEARTVLIQQVQALSPVAGSRIHSRPPLSPEARLDLDRLERNIGNEADKTLIKLHEELSQFWEKQIKENHTVEGAKDFFVVLSIANGNPLNPLTIQSIVGDPFYSRYTDSITNLNRALKSWAKVSELTYPNKDLSAEVELNLKEIKKTIKLLMFKCFVSSLKAALESYEIQKNIIQRGDALRLQNMDTPQEICHIIANLMRDANAEIFYGDALFDILTEYNDTYPPAIQDLIKTIETNTRYPFEYNTTQIEKRIEVKAKGDKIALSQVINRVGQGHIRSSRELHIKGNLGTLYFDADLRGADFRGKKIVIEAKYIEIVRECIINLYMSPYASASLFATSEIVGRVGPDENDNLVLTPDRMENNKKLNYTW